MITGTLTGSGIFVIAELEKFDEEFIEEFIEESVGRRIESAAEFKDEESVDRKSVPKSTPLLAVVGETLGNWGEMLGV